MVTLKRATVHDAELIWRMQAAAFTGLLAKYQDLHTNPGNEPLDKVQRRLAQPDTYFYLIQADEETVGAIRVVDRQDGSRKRISPLFILPQYCGRGYAQQAMLEAERIHGAAHWRLDTIAQERGNCYLYEKKGYRATGEAHEVKEDMTLIVCEK